MASRGVWQRVRGAALGLAAGLLARVWLSTLRVTVHEDPALATAPDRPWVIVFLHGAQWPLLAWRRRRRTVVLVSWSADGEIQARALALLGLTVVRGSSSRGGARGLAALVRLMKAGAADAAFAVDGPRGPRGVVKGGAIVAARAAGAVLVPASGRVRSGFVLQRAWDRFAVAWPFSRVEVRLGAPIEPEDFERARRAVQRSLGRELPRDGDDVDLDLRAARQGGDADGAARWEG